MATYVAKRAVRNGSLIAVNKRRTDGDLVPYLKEASTGRYREAIRDDLLTVDNPAIKDLISIIEQIDLEPIGSDFGQIDPGDLQRALDDFGQTIQYGFEDGSIAGAIIVGGLIGLALVGIIVPDQYWDIIIHGGPDVPNGTGSNNDPEGGEDPGTPPSIFHPPSGMSDDPPLPNTEGGQNNDDEDEDDEGDPASGEEALIERPQGDLLIKRMNEIINALGKNAIRKIRIGR